MLYSFDIFDTLITRTVCTPEGIFVLMQNRLMSDSSFSDIDDYIRENFAAVRSGAEHLARSEYWRICVEDVSLEQIYDAMKMTGRITDADIKRLMNLERETEIGNAVGIHENIEKLRKLKKQGEKVVLISDMYLDSQTIRAMLIHVDDIFTDIPIYVSSEVQYTKYGRDGNGELFQYVKDQEQVSYEHWIHVGDNAFSDYWVANALGIDAELFQPEPLRPFEEKLLESHFDCTQIQLAIGTARNLRMNEKLEIPASAGCSFSGYILFSYVWWVLTDSMRRGIKTLYFVARDGHIPMKIADRIIAHLGLPIEIHYVYGSRKAWRMASYTGKPGELTALFSVSNFDRIDSIEEYASVLGLSKEELFSFLSHDADLDSLSTLQVIELTKQLDSNWEFRSLLEERNRGDRELLLEYLRQTIRCSNEFAFVEMNGTGYTQKKLAELMDAFWDKPIQSYFFRMDRITQEEEATYYCFFPYAVQHALILEPMTRAMQEQTVGYVRRNEVVEPVLQGGEGRALKAYCYQEYEDGILAFADDFMRKIRWNKDKVDLALVRDYFDAFLKYPASEEFIYFADMPFSASGRETREQLFAPTPTKEHIRNRYLWDIYGNISNYYDGVSWEIGVLRCDEWLMRKRDFYRQNRMRIYKRLGMDDPTQLYPGREKIPYELLGKRIILYGAGKYGRSIYEELKRQGVTIVSWLDKNFETLKTQGFPVTGTIDDIGMIAYDRIIIATLGFYSLHVIWDELIQRGVPEEKIYCPAWEAFSFGCDMEKR